MTAAQPAIGSGFGVTATATEVLAGMDLTGALAIVTGGYSGIGLETTRALTRAGAHVLVRPGLAAALACIGQIEIDDLDLADLDSARVIAVSSRGHHFSPVRWDDVRLARGYDKWQAYGQAKSEVAEPTPADGTRTGVRDYAVDPVQAARLWGLSAELTGVDAFAGPAAPTRRVGASRREVRTRERRSSGRGSVCGPSGARSRAGRRRRRRGRPWTCRRCGRPASCPR